MPTLGKILTVDRRSTNDDNDDNAALSRPSSFSTQVSMGTVEEPVEVDPQAERQEAELRAKIKASLHSQHISRKVVKEEEAKKTSSILPSLLAVNNMNNMNVNMNMGSDNNNHMLAAAASSNSGQMMMSGGSSVQKQMGDDPTKPIRPLTAYHIFFQIEREYIIQTMDGDIADQSTMDNKVHLDDVPQRYKNIRLLPNWYAGPGKRKKRKHRKHHGKIGFLELSHIVNTRWAELEKVDPETKSFVQKIAKSEMAKYYKEMDRYKELTKDIFPEQTDPKKKKKKMSKKPNINVNDQQRQQQIPTHHQDNRLNNNHREEQRQQFNPSDDEQTFDWETQQQRRLKRQFFKQQAEMLKQSVEQQRGRRDDDNDNTLPQPSSSSTQVSLGIEGYYPSRASTITLELDNDNPNTNTNADNNDTQRQQTSCSHKAKPHIIPPGWIHFETVNNNDVLSGRGGHINNHPGNVAFRNIIETYKDEYLTTNRNPNPKKKAQIAAEIVSNIRSSGGRFLKEVPQTETWVEIGDEEAWKKASQVLKRGASEMRQVQRLEMQLYAQHHRQQQIPKHHHGIRQNSRHREEQRQQFNPQSPHEQTYTVNNTYDWETQQLKQSVDQQRVRHEQQNIRQQTAQPVHTIVTQALPPTTTAASTDIDTYMSLSQSAIDGASSLPQLYEIRNRLKTKLEYVENKINNEMMKKAFMMGQQAQPRTRNNPENGSERYRHHQSKKRRVDAESQPPAPIVTVRQNRNTIPSSIRHHGASVSETTPSSSPKRGKTLPTLTDQQQRQLSTMRQQEAAVSEESDGMSKDTISQYPCRDEDCLTHDQEISDTDQNVESTATQVKSEEPDIWMRVKEEETDDESVVQIVSSSTVSSSSSSVSKPTDVKRQPTRVYENGTKVVKYFYDENLGKRRAYQGCVVSFDVEVGWYKVIYEDGESEEYTHEELEGYLQE